MKPSSALFVLLTTLVGCGTPDGTLIVQVRTDLTPDFGFDSVRVSLRGEGVSRDLERRAADATDWGSGVRVAEIAALPLGTYQLTVGAFEGELSVVSRPVSVELEGGNRVVTVLLTRDCTAVACPGAGDASATACLGGRCVEEGCTEETPELCPAPRCMNDIACTSFSACATATCSPSGTCFENPDEGRCDPPEICDVTLGCIIAGACVDWERAVTTGGAAGPVLGRGQDLAATDSSVLVVWSDAGEAVWTSPRDARTGRGLAPPTRLTPSGSVPQITPTSGGALVTWRELRLVAGLVDSSGRLLGDALLLDAVLDGTDEWSAVATGGGALVSWTSGRRTDLNHAFTDLTSDFATAETTTQSTNSLSHVTSAPGVVMVCYEETEPAPGIRCEQHDATDGRLLAAPPTTFGGSLPSSTRGSVGEIGVASVGAGGILFHRVDSAGRNIPGSPISITPVTGTPAPALAYNGGLYALVYRTADGGLGYAQFRADSGAIPADVRELPTAGRLTGDPSLIARNGAFFATYRAGMPGGRADIYLQHICP